MKRIIDCAHPKRIEATISLNEFALIRFLILSSAFACFLETGGNWEESQNDKVVHQNIFDLPAGKYRLAYIMRDILTGNQSVQLMNFFVPPVSLISRSKNLRRNGLFSFSRYSSGIDSGFANVNVKKRFATKTSFSNKISIMPPRPLHQERECAKLLTHNIKSRF